MFDKPLEMNGREMADRLKKCLDSLNIKTTDDINDENTNVSNIHE